MAGEATTTPDAATEETARTDEPEPTKQPRKLIVQADLKPKKLSMIKVALQVLKYRKVALTCTELIDVIATEKLWTSPGGKTPVATLYAAISRSIKDEGKASAFRKTERGRFEAKILPKQYAIDYICNNVSGFRGRCSLHYATFCTQHLVSVGYNRLNSSFVITLIDSSCGSTTTFRC
jgi:hypothetical protein